MNKISRLEQVKADRKKAVEEKIKNGDIYALYLKFDDINIFDIDIHEGKDIIEVYFLNEVNIFLLEHQIKAIKKHIVFKNKDKAYTVKDFVLDSDGVCAFKFV